MPGDEKRREPQILRIFISYASEDLVIATALAKCFRDALGDVFAEINIDRWFLEAGEEFKNQIKSTLERTTVFISFYTGLNKQWPAWEVGFFEKVMGGDTKKRLVPIFLDTVPASISTYQGIGLKVPTAHLMLSVEQFAELNAALEQDDPMCRFLSDLQATVEEYREAAGYPKPKRTAEQDPVRAVQLLKLAIFGYLKTTVQETVRPQKQILIRTTGAALQQKTDTDIPNDARLVPAGQGNAMSTIFALTDAERSWAQFLEETAGNDHAESWKAAIVSVVTSSLPSRIDVDNSQIVVSSDNSKAYRVILTSTIRYYDDKREVNLYFVEALRRADFGDESTTLLLRALELSCRFRFMFFENSSPFSSLAVKLSSPVLLTTLAASVLRELNLLQKEAREAGLDQVSQWLKLVDGHQFAEIIQLYQPQEKKIRELAAKILECKGKPDLISTQQSQLVTALEDMRRSIEPGNSTLIQEMTSRLQAATTYPRSTDG